MANVTFSVVVTVLNEEQSINELIDTLINQSVVPGEIVIVDGGSTDSTAEIVEGKAKKSKIPIRLIVDKGSNRSRARNRGIDLAKHDYIAVTDAGCAADKNWLKQMEVAFVVSKNAKAVAGFYLPSTDNMLEEVFSKFLCVSQSELVKNSFLPSSRSVAFKKEIWEKIGGYPENLDTCEDLVFAKKMFDSGKMVVAEEAVVFWNMPKTFGQFFKMIAGYAEGDVRAGYRPHLLRILTVWARYLVFIVFPPLLLGYIFYVSLKFGISQISLIRLGYIIAAQFMADAGVILGSIRGLRIKMRSR